MAKSASEGVARFGLPEFRTEWGAIRRGIEKESLRVTPEGNLAQTAHPAALGSALTNPYITTDFSEALLEFITPPSASVEECLRWLEGIHRYSYQHLPDSERLWVCSMPCPVSNDESIPIARYGNSNLGQLKTLYRKGLSHRYGSLMQTIAGIHYNFSMPDNFWLDYQKIQGDQQSLKQFRTQSYLQLIRNFHRFSWLLFYLFGASPAACKCFVQGREHRLQELDPGSLYLPDATCLRMGDLGYRSEAQKTLSVCYNDLDSYLDSLNKALHTPYAPYQEIGVGEKSNHRQINTNLLQLENEFYSSVRPKRTAKRGQRPITALARDGIEYIEVRALDLNPFDPVGIDAEQIRFLDAFLLFCLLTPSPQCDQDESLQITLNTQTVVERGREASLMLRRNGDTVALKRWGDELLDGMTATAELLDGAQGTNLHRSSVEAQRLKLQNPELTPSGRMLQQMRSGNLSFFRFGMRQSEQNLEYFKRGTIANPLQSELVNASNESLLEQDRIEAADSVDFETFLRNWNRF